MDRASASEPAQQGVLDAFPVAAELWGGDGQLRHLNPPARELFTAHGLDPDAALHGAEGPFDHLEVVDQFGQPLTPADLPTAACLADGELHAGTVGVRTDASATSMSAVLDRRWFHLRAAPIPLPDGSQGVVATSLDVTRQYHLEEELRRAALHDPVTGLGNLRLLTLRHQQSQAAAERAGTLLGLVAVDVEGFEALIDRLGDAAGDRLLGRLGQRLATVTRTADTAARTGRSSFAVLCTDVTDTEDVRAAAARIAEALEGATDDADTAHGAPGDTDEAAPGATDETDEASHGATDDAPSDAGAQVPVAVGVGWVIVDPAMALHAALHRADRARHAGRDARDLG